MQSKTRRTAKLTPRQAFIHEFMLGECCGHPMNTGYDVVAGGCRHNGYSSEERNAYYAMCDHCGNIDVLCEQCVDDDVADNLNHWTEQAGRIGR